MNIEFENNISVENYNALRKAVGWRELSERQAENVIMNANYIIVATINSKPIGITRVLSDSGYIYFIADVIVLPEYQGKGVGKIVMNKAMDYINNDFLEGETVLVNLMSIKNKESFYEKFGFIRRPNGEFGDGMSQYITK